MELLLQGGAFFEAPRWHEGRWWVSDFYRCGVFSVDPDGTETEIVHVDGQPSGLGWLGDGSLLIVVMTEHRILRLWPDGGVTTHADLSDRVTTHLNDLVVDELGRAYVGSFGFDLMNGADPAPTDLHRIDPDGRVTAVADELWFPNGTVIDGDRLIVAETFGGGFTEFRIAANGDLTDRRSWGQVQPRPEPGTLAEVLAQGEFAPDGCCLDAEGHIWAADGLNTRVCRIAPGGAIVEQLDAPEGLAIFACMLGGEDGRTLLCCAAPDFSEHARKRAREACLYTTTVDVPHGGRP
jgi:sugar lactone lactonase YvrE